MARRSASYELWVLKVNEGFGGIFDQFASPYRSREADIRLTSTRNGFSNQQYLSSTPSKTTSTQMQISLMSHDMEEYSSWIALRIRQRYYESRETDDQYHVEEAERILSSTFDDPCLNSF